ncbi:hypothetical protein V6R86_07415 [Sphingomonas kaistensis]|uniref:Uncharacterized protein n=1 Tax=Sphingomonas kaistensis TaxID=298708 RepID=A0ABZ2G0S7_9SPHN
MFLSVVALLIAPAPPLQASRPALPGFIVGYKAELGGGSLLEEVPTGETVQKWTRMVTTQKFENIAYRLSPDRMMGSLATNYMTTCVGGTATEVGRDGDFSTVRADCPKNPQTGLPETMLARAIADEGTLHVFQVAWRRVPTAADLAWGEAYLKGIKLTPAG